MWENWAAFCLTTWEYRCSSFVRANSGSTANTIWMIFGVLKLSQKQWASINQNPWLRIVISNLTFIENKTQPSTLNVTQASRQLGTGGRHEVRPRDIAMIDRNKMCVIQACAASCDTQLISEVGHSTNRLWGSCVVLPSWLARF